MLSSYLPILSRLRPAPAATSVIAVDDDPATLARLAAIMSDRVQSCPNCGGDPHVCRAIGCDVDNAPLLLSQPSVDRSGNLDDAAPLIDEVFAREKSEVVAGL